MAYWTNQDLKRKEITIHQDGCGDVFRKEETREKGVGRLRSMGGWLEHPTHQEARDYARKLKREAEEKKKKEKPWKIIEHSCCD